MLHQITKIIGSEIIYRLNNQSNNKSSNKFNNRLHNKSIKDLYKINHLLIHNSNSLGFKNKSLKIRLCQVTMRIFRLIISSLIIMKYFKRLNKLRKWIYIDVKKDVIEILMLTQ